VSAAEKRNYGLSVFSFIHPDTALTFTSFLFFKRMPNLGTVVKNVEGKLTEIKSTFYL
jgi:hypothetical protein